MVKGLNEVDDISGWGEWIMTLLYQNQIVNVQIVPKENTIGIWVSIAKEPFMESEKLNQIMKLWLLFYIQWIKIPSDLAK